MIPIRSPYGLIQEDLWPDTWKCLVSCLMLNCTSRKQVEKILPEFFNRWPSPADFLAAGTNEVSDLIACLGFRNRRTQRLFDMTRAYINEDWKHASDLPGIGEYAARAWEMFFVGELGDEPPKDGALTLYWHWAKGIKR
jgi:endonuclease III